MEKPDKNKMKGLEEMLKEECSMFNSVEEYLAWVNEECRGIAKEKNLELEPRFFNKLVRE